MATAAELKNGFADLKTSIDKLGMRVDAIKAENATLKTELAAVKAELATTIGKTDSDDLAAALASSKGSIDGLAVTPPAPPA